MTDFESVICENCEDDEAEQFCEDCPHGSQHYCSDCAEHHIKSKRYAHHHMKVIGDKNDSNLLPFSEFLRHLDWSYFMERKVVYSDAVVIRNTDYNASSTFQPQELLPIVLQKVMACNHHCRQVVLQEKTSHKPYPSIVHHPMDTLLAVILSCDPIFLQDVFKCLYACKLAIPLLLPNPDTKQIIFPLWAMREMVSKWKYCNAAGEYIPCEGRLVDCEAPIVSFMRLNKVRNFCKSNILNGVINDHSQHKYFFDSECLGSDAKRCYVDGLAEISWYLPSGNPKSDIFSTPVAFCNLRGDARDHLTQFKVLTNISQICFLFVRNDDVNESLMKMLYSTSRNNHVCLLMNVSKKDILSHIPNCSVLYLKRDIRQAAIVENIRLKISEILFQSPQKQQAISACLDPWNFETSFKTDEVSDPCNTAGKYLADKFMSLVASDKMSPDKAKQLLVPLQGPDLWQEWAKENRRQKRLNRADVGDMSMEEFYSHQDKRKLSIVKKIVNIGFSNGMKIFVDALIGQPDEKRVRLYFLHWLKMKLDDYSKKAYSVLRSEYEITRKELRKLKADDFSSKNQEKFHMLRKKLHQSSHDLISASFGVEHLFREFGVIYEMLSITFPRPELWSQVKRFPKIAAEVLMDGQPLELFDGNAGHIAINWITAILGELKYLIGGESKLFVLSVLGIQSTGKSVLLNTAFGLRFPVGVGRCTTGALFQLLKCDQSAFKGICDYMLVIDTEGLRAPEFEDMGTHSRDNELATLAIGLADLTIVNVFGEVFGDVDDILQTSVHAFLRMKEAGLRPSCFIVRHHVNEFRAANKEGLYRLQDKLDNMTVYAARAEHCEGLIKKFSDVIQFDVATDVYNFPNLWSGNPPMSPVAPEYSEAAQRLKMEVIKRMVNGSISVCTLENFSLRVSQLWDAILRENLIFNFNNTLEIAAYNDLDHQSARWSWDLESVVKYWKGKARNVMYSSREFDNLEGEMLKEVEVELNKKHEQIKKEMSEFFERHKAASILIQWKEQTKHKFMVYTEFQKKEAWQFLRRIIQHYTVMKKVKTFEFRQLIEREIESLVYKMKLGRSTKMTSEMERQLHSHFSKKWEEWVREIDREMGEPPRSGNTEDEMLQVIYEHGGITHLHTLIKEKVRLDPLSSRRNDHFEVNVSDNGYHINWIGVDLQRQRTQEIIRIKTKEIIDKQRKYLDSIASDDEDCPIGDVIKIVQIIQSEIDELQNHINKSVSFTAEYRADVILTVCGYAYRVFENLKERSNKNHPVAYFKSCEQMYRKLYVSLFQQYIEEKGHRF